MTVTAGGRVIARSDRPKLLFETGLPMRVYVPRSDIVPGVLGAGGEADGLPLQGAGDATGRWTGSPDAAWSYEAPLPEAIKAQGHVCFDEGEGVDVDLGAPRAQLPT